MKKSKENFKSLKGFKQSKRQSKLLATVIALVLAVSMIPIGVNADLYAYAAEDAGETEEKLTLTSEVTLTYDGADEDTGEAAVATLIIKAKSTIKKLSAIQLYVTYPDNFKFKEAVDGGFFGEDSTYYNIGNGDSKPLYCAFGCNDSEKKGYIEAKEEATLVTLKFTAEKLVKNEKYTFEIVQSSDEKPKAFLLTANENEGAKTESYKVEDVTETTKKTCTAIKGTEKDDTTISGNIISWDNTGTPVVKLYNYYTSDNNEIKSSDIRDDMRTADRSKAISEVEFIYGTQPANKTDLKEGTTNKKVYSQVFSFKGELNAGKYKLAIYKPKIDNKDPYVVSVVEVNIANDGTVTFEGNDSNVKMWLYGDVTWDGTINASDAEQVLRYATPGKTSKVIIGNDTSCEGTNQFEAADITKDGSLNASDAEQILRHATPGKTSKKFEDITN